MDEMDTTWLQKSKSSIFITHNGLLCPSLLRTGQLYKSTRPSHMIYRGTDIAMFNIQICDDILNLTAAVERTFYLDRHDGLQLMRC